MPKLPRPKKIIRAAIKEVAKKTGTSETAVLRGLAKNCGVGFTTARQWRDKGCWPYTEFTGQTMYAHQLALLCSFTVEELHTAKPQ